MRSFFVLFFSAAVLTSCDSGAELCCGYETRQDITSDVSIVRDEGTVVYQNVSAIIDDEGAYLIEIRTFDREADELTYLDCTYATISKGDGSTRSFSTDEFDTVRAVSAAETGRVSLKTKNSCLHE